MASVWKHTLIHSTIPTHSIYEDWIGSSTEQCFTSPPTQYRLYGRRFLQVKRPNQQYQSTEGGSCKRLNIHSFQLVFNTNLSTPRILSFSRHSQVLVRYQFSYPTFTEHLFTVQWPHYRFTKTGNYSDVTHWLTTDEVNSTCKVMQILKRELAYEYWSYAVIQYALVLST